MTSDSNDKLDEMIFHLKNIFECLVDSFFERNTADIERLASKHKELRNEIDSKRIKIVKKMHLGDCSKYGFNRHILIERGDSYFLYYRNNSLHVLFDDFFNDLSWVFYYIENKDIYNSGRSPISNHRVYFRAPTTKENILKIFKNEFRIDGNLGKPFVDLFEFNYSWIENGAFTRTGVRYDSNV